VDQDLRQTELEIEKRNLALKVKRAYFDILRANRNLQVASQAIETISAHVNTASMYFEVGKIPADDLLEAELRLANWQEEWIHAQNEVYSARVIFNMLLSRPLETSFMIADILMFEPVSITKETYLGQALNNRPELKAIDLNLKRAALEKQIVQSDYYPNVSLRADYIKEGDDPLVQGSDFHKEDNWLASVVLTWRFWEWGKTYYSGKEKQSLKKQLLHTRAALIDQISLEIKEALLALQRTEKNIPTTSKAVKLAAENLRIKQERYQMQINTSTDVLDALTLFSVAQNNYNSTLYDHNLAKAKLAWALGDY
jgi:outer membrane protein TolC